MCMHGVTTSSTTAVLLLVLLLVLLVLLVVVESDGIAAKFQRCKYSAVVLQPVVAKNLLLYAVTMDRF